MNRAIVFLDIDGTLFGRDHVIAPSTLDAIHTAQRNGHLVFIDTGRSRPEIDDEVLAPGFDGIVGAIGAYVEIDGKVLLDRFIDPAVVTHASHVFDEIGVNYMWQSSRGLWASAGYMAHVDWVRRTMHPGYGGDWWRVLEDAKAEAWLDKVPLGELVPGSKCTFFAPSSSRLTLDDIREAVGPSLKIVSGSMGLEAPTNGEGMTPGVNKGTGLRYVADLYGVDIADTVAIGDSENDTEMIETAGVGVAMGNATDGIKSVADWVTTAVDDDGIAHAFEHLGLI
ncbi:HAD family hydrolase [Bifidobacterium rousetti]|uniref:HAD family hydrolase n=1 Tax=Bifidobacterium rousetti TaxID=2045439 RepID=UPI00168A547C|nr:HAD family hydrolase [Bifidobacterium rousetti]